MKAINKWNSNFTTADYNPFEWKEKSKKTKTQFYIFISMSIEVSEVLEMCASGHIYNYL